MQRRCCWPPDMPKALSVEAVLDLVPERGAAQRRLDDLVHVALHARGPAGRRRCCRRSTSGTGSASGRPSRCACAPATGVDVGAVEVLAVVERPARRPSRAGIRSFIRLRQRSSVDLPQPDGPMSAVISFAVDLHRRRRARRACRRSGRRRPRARRRRRRSRGRRRRGARRPGPVRAARRRDRRHLAWHAGIAGLLLWRRLGIGHGASVRIGSRVRLATTSAR